MPSLVRTRCNRRRGTAAACLAVALLLAGSGPARAATVTFTESGVSGAGNPITVSATLVTSGTTLSIALSNIGPRTKAVADVLTSFYFGIADPNDGLRPILTYLSATGTACQVFAGAANDSLVSWQTNPQQLFTTPPASLAASNLVAQVAGDSGWQFRAFTNVAPQLGFGIGTVGNSMIASVAGPGYAGATFDPRIVSETGPPGRSMINLGIYSNGNQPFPGDIDPVGDLSGATLVNTRALFLFGSSKNLDSFGQSWVQGNVTFGFGTGPSTVLLPEPGGIAMATSAAVVVLGWLAHRRPRRPRPT
jgi:hypothetical protein